MARCQQSPPEAPSWSFQASRPDLWSLGPHLPPAVMKRNVPSYWLCSHGYHTPTHWSESVFLKPQACLTAKTMCDIHSPLKLGPFLCARCPRWKSDAFLRCTNTHIEQQCTAQDSSLPGQKIAPEFQVPPTTITASSQEMSLGRDHPCRRDPPAAAL